jgi:hypothetical protein
MQSFMQRQVNRLQTGQARYGPPIATKRYLTRLSAEVDAYVLTGNAEHLINAANYCLLESIAPEHKKFHFDNTVESVMRRAPKKEHRVWK